MNARFEGPRPAPGNKGKYPTWRWGVIWSNRGINEGIEWSFGVNHGTFFHLMLQKGGMYREGIACRLILWRLASLFVEVHLPWEPHPFSICIDTHPRLGCFYAGPGGAWHHGRWDNRNYLAAPLRLLTRKRARA